MKLKTLTYCWIIYFFLAFPLFYFVYKYGTPDLGMKDFYDYYKLYKNWDIAHVDAPFNMRLLSSFFVYIFNSWGLHYDTLTAFDKTGLDKQVFFNAVFFNFICVVTTCAVICYTVKSVTKNFLLAFVSGCIYILGFGTIFFELMPITDSLSVLLFALILYGYLKRKYWILIIFLLLIFQREYIFMALGLVALMDYLKYRDTYFIRILISCCICFGLYYVFRKTLFYTPKYDHQASAGYFMDMFRGLRFALLPYFKQTFMTMNIFFIYILVLIYKHFNSYFWNKYELWKIILLFLQINLISFAAVFGNNTGRYFYILVPLIIYQLSVEIYPLLQEKKIN